MQKVAQDICEAVRRLNRALLEAGISSPVAIVLDEGAKRSVQWLSPEGGGYFLSIYGIEIRYERRG